MAVIIFFVKTVLLIAVSFGFFLALAAGLGADLGADFAVSQAQECRAVDFKNCLILIF